MHTFCISEFLYNRIKIYVLLGIGININLISMPNNTACIKRPNQLGFPFTSVSIPNKSKTIY
jgi:hypothetical protein